MFFKHRASHMVDFNSWVREREPLTLHDSVTKLSSFRVCSRSCSPSLHSLGSWLHHKPQIKQGVGTWMRKHLWMFGAESKWRYFGVVSLSALIAQPGLSPLYVCVFRCDVVSLISYIPNFKLCLSSDLALLKSLFQYFYSAFSLTSGKMVGEEVLIFTALISRILAAA